MAKKQKNNNKNILGEFEKIKKGFNKHYKQTKNIEDLTAIELLDYYDNLESKIKRRNKIKKFFNLMLIPLIPIASFFFYQYNQSINKSKQVYFSNKTGYYDVYSIKKYDLLLDKNNNLNLKYKDDLRLIINKNNLKHDLKQEQSNSERNIKQGVQKIKKLVNVYTQDNKQNVKHDSRYEINKVKGVYYLLDKKEQINYKITNLINYDLKDMIYFYGAKHKIPEYKLPDKIVNIILDEYNSSNLYSDKTKDKFLELIIKDRSYIPNINKTKELISRYSKKQELFDNLSLHTIENIIEYNISRFTDEQKKKILNDIFIPIIFSQISNNAKNIGVLITNLYHNYIESKNELKEKQYLDSLKVHKQNLDLLIKLYKNK